MYKCFCSLNVIRMFAYMLHELGPPSIAVCVWIDPDGVGYSMFEQHCNVVRWWRMCSLVPCRHKLHKQLPYIGFLVRPGACVLTTLASRITWVAGSLLNMGLRRNSFHWQDQTRTSAFQVDSSPAAASRSSRRDRPWRRGRTFARKRDARSPAACTTRCAETACAWSWPAQSSLVQRLYISSLLN